MTRLYSLLALTGLFGYSVAFGATPKGSHAAPQRPAQMAPRPAMRPPITQPVYHPPAQQVYRPAVNQVQQAQFNQAQQLRFNNQVQQAQFSKPVPTGGGPRPVINNLPSSVNKPLATGPRPAVTNVPNGTIRSQQFVNGANATVTNLQTGRNNINVVGKPSSTLLTNPHPGVTNNVNRANTVGRRPAVAQNHAIVAGPAAGLGALSAINPNLTPANLALYAYSQRNASHPWWTPYGYGGYGYGGYGYGGYGYGGYGYGRLGGFAGIGFAPYGFNPFLFGSYGWGGWGYGGGFGIGIGFGYGGAFGYAPAIAYVPQYVESPVIVEQPVIVSGPAIPSANPPLIPQLGPTLPSPARVEKPTTVEKPVVEPEVDFAARGQEQFLAGKYAEAVKTLKHAVLDDPKNGPLLALTGEALWAAGSFNEAAGALQQSLLATPEADWVGVSSRAARLIPVSAVTALGTALTKEEQPGLRFLAAYQSFGAGQYQEAAAHLDVVIKKAPDDQVAKKLREQAVKLSEGK